MAHWKDLQTKTKRQKRTKLAIWVLSAVILFLIISWIFRFTQNLFQTDRSYIWSGEFNINLVVRSKGLSLFSYNPKEEKIVIVYLPDNIFLDVPSGFGKWQLGSVYDLGGDQLLEDTLTSFLAIPIDGFVDFGTSTKQKSIIEIVDILRQTPVSGLNLLSNLKTNLTAWELFKLKLSIAAVRFDKITELDLEQLDVLDQENLPDGTPILVSDPVKLDSILTYFQDPAIVAERASIAVLNATNSPQLAIKWARLITNLGGNVIITANASKKLDRTQVVGDESLTLKRLRQIFELGCLDRPKCDRVDQTDKDSLYQRAQINLLLGENYIGK